MTLLSLLAKKLKYYLFFHSRGQGHIIMAHPQVGWSRTMVVDVYATA
jgi:hypothetical protein